MFFETLNLAAETLVAVQERILYYTGKTYKIGEVASQRWITFGLECAAVVRKPLMISDAYGKKFGLLH